METSPKTITKLLAQASTLSPTPQNFDLWFKDNAKAIIICSIFIAVFFVVLIGCLWSICSTIRGKKLRKELEKKAKQQQQQEAGNDSLYRLNNQDGLSFRPNQHYNGEKLSTDITIGKPCEEEEYGLLTPEAQLEYEYVSLMITFI